MKINMPSKLQLSDVDRALFAGASGADLADLGPTPITLNQALSPAVLPGDGNVPSAKLGGYVVPYNDKSIPVERFRSIVFAFTEDFREYRPNRGGLACPPYSEMPADARWYDDRTPLGNYRDNGNIVEDTINCFMLVVGLRPTTFGGVFRFARTSLTVGRDLGNRAQRLKVEGENIAGMIIGMWEWSSRHVPKPGGKSYYSPVLTLVGKLGEAKGPSLEWVRFAAQLRQKFKEGLPWAPEPPVPPGELEKPAAQQGSVTIKSGKQAWDDERPPLPDRYDGPDGDDIPF
jgi:hypothetical protein